MNRVGCLRCNMDVAKVRGCCWRCYGRYQCQVRSGVTSWAELERLGRVYPPKPKKRPWEKRS